MRRIIAVSIALAVVALAAVGVRSYWPRELDPIRRLTEVSSTSARDIEPRLTGGFRWAPLRKAKRGGDELKGDGLMLAAVAGETIQKVPQDRHAVGIAQLMIGKPRVAAATLEAIAGSSAEVWSDLAAARYTLAIGDDDPSQLPRALAAADAALHLNPNLPEARFNRALVIERLGLRDQAREQWDAYLAVDGGSEWANEARQHVRDLHPLPVFKEELERSYERLASDPAAAHAFARQYRQDSRLWGETEILGRWATAERDGNHELALKHLGLARELGDELARDRGDSMLQSLVAAIDRADAQQRGALITAHLAFRDGQKTYKNDQPAKAEPILLAAADAFDRGNSPGALLARYFAANTAYSQGRIAESRKTLERLLADSPPDLIAHRAQVLWQLGLIALANAEWGSCIETLRQSVTTFDRLDERMYAATVRQILATAYDRIGNRNAAWTNRTIALRDLGQRQTSRVEIMLSYLARSAARDRDWTAAAALFGLAIDVAHRVNDPPVEIETLTLRAKAYLRMNDPSAAALDLRLARSRLQNVVDRDYRQLLEANLQEAEATLTTDQNVAVELLTRAIEFHRTKGRRIFLPELLLERGRAYLASDGMARAAEDFEAGIAELETRRATLPGGEDRWGVFHDAEDLFAEAIALSLAQHETQRAFDYAERARARALLEALGSTWPAVKPSDIPADSIIVEYAVQAKTTVIFVVDRDGARVVQHAVDRAVLADEVAELTTAASTSDLPRLTRVARRLHRHLIEPIAHELAGTKIVFVPDSTLGPVPFAALIDGTGRFLIENHALTVAPSAAVHVRLAHRRAVAAERNVLVVTGSEELGRLSAAEREIASVAATYRNVTRLPRDTATEQEFVRRAESADVIHFVGHAVASPDGGNGAYLSLLDGSFGVREIAALRLDRTSLVVLAACGTAAGEIRSTEGTISIARSFLAAGVPSVIATLWPIEDQEAAEFFPTVHRNIARGMAPAEALRAVQIEWIHRQGASTAMWTAVQVVGN